jgi:hypothetical protein
VILLITQGEACKRDNLTFKIEGTCYSYFALIFISDIFRLSLSLWLCRRHSFRHTHRHAHTHNPCGKLVYSDRTCAPGNVCLWQVAVNEAHVTLLFGWMAPECGLQATLWGHFLELKRKTILFVNYITYRMSQNMCRVSCIFCYVSNVYLC